MSSALMKIGLYSWGEMAASPTGIIPWLGIGYQKLGGVPTDAEMTFAANNNIEVLYLLTPSIPDASYSAGTNATFIATHLSAIDTYLGAYGPRGTFWAANPHLRYNPIAQMQISLEPNFYWPNATSRASSHLAAADLYAQLLIACYNRIKASWPEVTTIGFGLGCASAQGPAFLNNVLAYLRSRGQIAAFDVLGINMYTNNTLPEFRLIENWGSWSAAADIGSFRASLNSAGLNVPIWNTEAGFWISHMSGGAFNQTGPFNAVTPLQQAGYTLRLNMMFARLGVERSYHMFVVDSDNYNGGWFDNSWTARPVAYTMRYAMRRLVGATQLAIVADGNTGGPFIYRFTIPRGAVTVAWCDAAGTYTIPLNPASTTTVTDVQGRVLSQPVNASTYPAALSEIPIVLSSTFRRRSF